MAASNKVGARRGSASLPAGGAARLARPLPAFQDANLGKCTEDLALESYLTECYKCSSEERTVVRAAVCDCKACTASRLIFRSFSAPRFERECALHWSAQLACGDRAVLSSNQRNRRERIV